MPKNRFYLLVPVFIFLLLLSGCTQKTGNEEVYISLMSVPSEATIPTGLRLDSILSVTNANTESADAEPFNIQFGVFGYTDNLGNVNYYVYGKKQSISNDEVHLMEEGFYPVDFSKENQAIKLNLASPRKPLDKLDPGTGATSSYSGELPYYYAETDKPGLYTFIDANGNSMLRCYAIFVDQNNGNFFPATDEGKMISGSLPIDPTVEDCLKTQGSNAASQLLTTPIPCNDIQVVYPD